MEIAVMLKAQALVHNMASSVFHAVNDYFYQPPFQDYQDSKNFNRS
jgi:hypothetical protein